MGIFVAFALGAGVAVGFRDGSADVGFVVGKCVDGTADGGRVGFTDGTADDGFAVGLNVDGTVVGSAEGFCEGLNVVGLVDGFAVGLRDGIIEDGFFEGLKDGFEDGDCVGEMKPVSVKQSTGFKHVEPLHVPLQQLPSTNKEKQRKLKINFKLN